MESRGFPRCSWRSAINYFCQPVHKDEVPDHRCIRECFDRDGRFFIVDQGYIHLQGIAGITIFSLMCRRVLVIGGADRTDIRIVRF